MAPPLTFNKGCISLLILTCFAGTFASGIETRSLDSYRVETQLLQLDGLESHTLDQAVPDNNVPEINRSCPSTPMPVHMCVVGVPPSLSVPTFG